MKKRGETGHLTWWAVLVWLLVWQAAAMAADLPIFFVTPVRVLVKLAELVQTASFWRSAGYTMVHIIAGFLLAVLCALVLAIPAAASKRFAQLLAPPMLLIRSVPVVSFIILALICFSSKRLSILISFLMVLPILYANLSQGIRQCDRELLEMAEVFRIGRVRTARYVYVPQVYPYFRAACASAMGIAWKSGTAAEVIGMPVGSIGEKLQEAKTYLMTADLFAWTLLIVVLSLITERIGMWVIDGLYRVSQRMRAGSRSDRSVRGPVGLRVEDLGKSYDGKLVLNQLSAQFPAGRTSVVMGPSGEGKTTLLRILAGLEKPDSGRIAWDGADPAKVAFVFQEDRLLDHQSAEDNIRLCAPAERTEEEILAGLEETGLIKEMTPGKSVCDFSGGMRRRAALLRALLADWDVLVLDEPYKGLDADTRERVMAYVRAKTAGRTVILVTHDPAEAEQADGTVLRLERESGTA